MFAMNGYESHIMREIQNDQRLYLIFNAYVSAPENEKSKYSFVRYEDTGRLDILYNKKTISLAEAEKKRRNLF